MKVYVAARLARKSKVRVLYERLSRRGFIIASDWTKHGIIKPYEKNKELSKKYSIEAINAVRDSDIFILISDKEGTGMYIELGAAVLMNLKFGKPKIYIIGHHLSRSMFYFHPTVNRRKTIEQVFKELEESR